MKTYVKINKNFSEIYCLKNNQTSKADYYVVQDDSYIVPENYLELITTNEVPDILDDEEIVCHLTKFSDHMEREFIVKKIEDPLPDDVEALRDLKISKKKLHDNMKAVGLWNTFKNFIYANEDLKELWEISLTLQEQDPYVQVAIQTMKQVYGLTDDDINNLLISSKSDLN